MILTSVSNQNFSENCKKILVYVPIVILAIASCFQSTQSELNGTEFKMEGEYQEGLV